MPAFAVYLAPFKHRNGWIHNVTADDATHAVAVAWSECSLSAECTGWPTVARRGDGTPPEFDIHHKGRAPVYALVMTGNLPAQRSTRK